MKLILSTATFGILAQSALARFTEITNNVSGTSKCLDVQGGVLALGTPVQIYDCNNSQAQNWTFSRTVPTSIKVGSSNYCLDAGSTPANGVGLKIWECFDGLAAQTWFYTDDNRIALYNQGLCVDLTNGDSTNGNRVQTWHCTDGNKNQEWIETDV